MKYIKLFETYLNKRLAAKQDKKRNIKRVIVSKEFLLENRPDECPNIEYWEKAVNSSTSMGQQPTVKDVISTYKYLIKNMMYTISKYKTINKK